MQKLLQKFERHDQKRFVFCKKGDIIFDVLTFIGSEKQRLMYLLCYFIIKEIRHKNEMNKMKENWIKRKWRKISLKNLQHKPCFWRPKKLKIHFVFWEWEWKYEIEIEKQLKW